MMALLAEALAAAEAGDIEACRRRLRRLTPDQLRAARTTLLRCAAQVDIVTYEPPAEVIPVPVGVEGFAIHGRETEHTTPWEAS